MARVAGAPGSGMFGSPNDPDRPRWIIIASTVIVIAIAVPLVWIALSPAPSSPMESAPSVPASIGAANGSAIALDDGFLGVNLRADEYLAGPALSALNATGIRFVRWPGGELGDRFDPLADNDTGTIVPDDGIAFPANTSLAEFTRWCRAEDCRAVITLPAEIDNASFAEAIVNYTERTLGLRPAYWEIGNEPALWRHFDIPWSAWNDSQNVTPTPEQYAGLVGAYVSAIRAVDPATPIIGIGGIGLGASGVARWFDPTLEADGPNLSAMAIHVYPAGAGYPSTDLSDWFASLAGETGLPARVANASAAIAAGCPACRISVLVDEFQTGTDLTAADSLSGGYLAAYVGAEIVDALPLPIASLDYFDLQGTTPGAWLGPTGAPSPALELYEALHGRLGTYAEPLVVSSSLPGLEAAAGGNSTTGLDNLLLVNTNPQYSYRVDASERFPGLAASTAWIFNGSGASPVVVTVPSGAAANWTIAPGSVVLLTVGGSTHSVVAGVDHLGTRFPSAFPPPSFIPALARWSPPPRVL